MSTITKEQERAIADWLAQHELSAGIGTKESACSIAAINLALSGRLTDAIPECMSPVIGKWIIVMQDAMPADMRNSAQWKALLPRAAGTGRQREAERLALIMDWMWTSVLPQLQLIADKGGFGAQWATMCKEKTASAANAAYARAAYAARTAARAAASAAYAASTANAWAAARTASAAWAAARANAYAASDAAASAAYAYAAYAYWSAIDPTALLAKLIDA